MKNKLLIKTLELAVFIIDNIQSEQNYIMYDVIKRYLKDIIYMLKGL